MERANTSYEIKEIVTQKRVNAHWGVNLLNAPTMKWYLLICCLYIAFLVIDHNFILTKQVYINSMSVNGYIDNNKLQFISDDFNHNFWSSIGLIPIVILGQILLISFCVMMGFILKEIKISFLRLIELVTKALIVFPIMDILLSIELLSRHTIHTVADTRKPDWHSLMFFFNRNDVPVWLIYPLKTINLAEFFFLAIMYYQLNQLSKKIADKKPIFTIALISYVLGLMFWVVALIFWQMTSTN